MNDRLLAQITNPVLPGSLGSGGVEAGGSALGAVLGGVIGVLPMAQCNTVETSKGIKYLEVVCRIPLKADYAMFPDGKKLHKQCYERLPNEAAAASFNF